MNINSGAYKSPGKKHGIDFLFEGEIRFGPTYYRVQLDGEEISDRIFGFEFKWHPESKYLALQEWLTTDYQLGPITTLTLVELESRKSARISKADKGFIRPIRFENEIIIFEKEFPASGKKGEYELNLDEVVNWEK